MRFGLIIDGVVADLFQDESISLIRQVKDFTDLSTVFTDYTQSFQIPATDINNGIFDNYFDENIVLGSWSPAFKLSGEIHIDSLPVFYGEIELLEVNFKDGLPRDYNIVFYGQGKSLVTEWGEKLMNEIDWSIYDHAIDDTIAVSSWTGGLFSGDIVWDIKDYGQGFTYSSFGIGNNIAIGQGISSFDLRPSIKLKKVVERIFQQAGYTLGGTLLARAEMDNLFVTPMNNAGPLVDFNAAPFGVFEASSTSASITTSSSALSTWANLPLGNTIVSNPSGAWNNTTFEYTVPRNGDYEFLLDFALTGGGSDRLTIRVNINNKVVAGGTYSGTPSDWVSLTPLWHTLKRLVTGDVVTITYRATGAFTMTGDISCIGSPNSVQPYIYMAEAFPNIKIVDFLNVFLKTFNAVIIPNGKLGFNLYNIQDWYALGANKDYTNYVDFDTINHKKQPIPKSISMKHKDGDSMAQLFFKNIYDREYGSIKLSPQVDYSAEDLIVESLFMVNPPMRMNSVDSMGVVVAETDIDLPVILDNDAKGIKQDFILFYFQGTKTVIYPYQFGGVTKTTQPVSSPYSATPTTPSSYSVAFGLEGSIDGDIATKSLFMNFWNEFISRIYSSRSRIVTFKAYIPVGEWITMQLNDTIVVSGNYYKIQKITYDVLTELAAIELITYPNVQTIVVTSSTGNKPVWTDPTGTTEGLTFIKGQQALKGIFNATSYGGDLITDAVNINNYNDSSGLKMQSVIDNYVATISLNQIIIMETSLFTQYVDGTFTGFNLDAQFNEGDTELYTSSLSTSSITINQSGQYRIRAVIVAEPLSGLRLEAKIKVDGLLTEAYSKVTGANIHTISLNTSLTIGESSVVQLGVDCADGTPQNCEFSRVSLTIEKIL